MSNMSDSDQDIQEKIEKELFEDYDKILDRIFSLIKFIFVIFGFYAVILYDIHGKLDKGVFINAPDPDISTISILFCFLSIIPAFYYLFNLLVSKQNYKFEELNNLIQYRKGIELKRNNLKMFSEIKKMNNHYKLSVNLIGVSLTFFCCYLRPVYFYSFVIFLLPIVFRIVFKQVAKIIRFLKLSVS